MKPSEVMDMVADLGEYLQIGQSSGATGKDLAEGLVGDGWVTNYPEGWNEDND